MALKDTMNKVRHADFPEGKKFYVVYFTDLILKNAKPYEKFETHSLIKSLKLSKDDNSRFNQIERKVYDSLLENFYVKTLHYPQQLMLTSLGVEINEAGGLVKHLLQKLEKEKLEKSKTEKSLGTKVWLGITENKFVSGLLLFIVITILTYYLRLYTIFF